MELLLVDRSDSERAQPMMRADGSPALVPVDAAAGLFEQIGRNTSYILHPEEIIASNFALLATGETRVPSPELLEAIRRVMTAHSRAPE